MNKKSLSILFIIALLITAIIPVGAQTPPVWKLSFSERVRWEGWDNAVNLDRSRSDGQSYLRARSSLGLTWRPTAAVEIGLKLTNEFRTYQSPKDKPFTLHEVIFDNLYFKWSRIGGGPLSVTIGRQNLSFGEGFVVMDANPLDGSRTAYFNALRGDYILAAGHILTAFAVHMPVRDTWLPRLHDQRQPLIEKPETGIGLYYAGKAGKFGIEGYLIHKAIAATAADPLRVRFQTIGGRLVWGLSETLSLTGEGAAQFGGNQLAGGGLVHADFQIRRAGPVKTVTVGGVWLSGDDPETSRNEGWDPLFSRWPKWSESYIYTLIREYAPAYWSNYSSLYGSLRLDLMENLNALLTLQFLGAPQSPAADFPGGSGRNRGTLLISRVNFKMNSSLSGHFIWEHLGPGSYYFADAASSNWLRFELLLSL